jgi:ABC-type nitrate/sulfonate/bicarbonate transport system substrate-binding protein
MGTTNRLSALQSGEVAAATVFQVGATQAENEGYAEVLARPSEYDQLSQQTVQFWVTLEEALEDREDQIRAQIEPLQEAYQQTYDRDPATIAQEAKDTGFYGEFGVDVLQQTLEHYRDVNMWPVDGGLTEESVNKAYDLLVSTGLLEEDIVPEYSDIVDDRFLNR